MPRSSQSRPQCAQIADHLAQNTPNSLNFTEVVCTLGASIPNTANMETAARPTGIATASVGGGRAWPDNEPTHRTTRQQPAPPAWRAPEGTGGRAAVPVGGGRAWPGFETTRRATLAARTARGRAAAHGHRHTKQPGSASGRADPHQSPRPHRCGGHRRDRRARAGFEARHRAKRGRLASRAAGPSGARNTRGA